MDKSMIPTEEFKLPVSGKVVKHYQYLTQAESDELLRIQLGDATFDSESRQFTGLHPISLMNADNRMVEMLAAEFTPEEFQVMHPDDRNALKNSMRKAAGLATEEEDEEPKKKK